MSYFKQNNNVGSYSALNNTGLGGLNKSTAQSIEFYELEPAVVLDVILDENHPMLVDKKIDVSSFPENYLYKTPDPASIDYTWIGRALVRQCISQQGVVKEQLNWAMPMDVTGVIEYPLINETVVIAKYFGTLYYSKKLNLRGFVNNNGDYRKERLYGINSGTGIFGPISLLTNKQYSDADYKGSLGKYFLTNNYIRRLRKYEGDTSVESRFGQSIRFSAYDSIRDNDVSTYIDYATDKSINPGKVGGGNPMILIRNRQRKLSIDKPIYVHPLLPPIPSIKNVEKNVGGLIDEDINHDGSSIHITSGLTETKWITTVYKTMFGQKSEEQPKYNGQTAFKYPSPLNGDQIVINTDRLIFSSRFGETFHFSKKRYSVVTDSEYTVDAQDQVVITTNNKTVINSPSIYLGQYGEANEPALLGQTNVNWLYDLCVQLENLCTALSNHTHPDPQGGSTGIPNDSNTDVSIGKSIEGLRNILNTLLSRRVFVTGGGLAPGVNGVLTPNYDGTAKAGGIAPEFKGANKRLL